ncbi:hypothetical protein CCAX7_33310 [Capsulimonas corticalis]|uniref:DUF6745 domain-containing protein n=1 Tax=Capsulimonas corticalis TaxID=2219043 RepID=A0A402CYP1_9BACT|nr:hypothetical protein [Capsulimonas corticalis]BDI31280.1 hypothetical protein CCAX7_33310 [Capsulimonas corticalis]
MTTTLDRILTPSIAQAFDRAQIESMILAGRAPRGLRVHGHLSFAGNRTLTQLPEDLRVDSLDLSGCANLTSLPEGLRATRLDCTGCHGLTSLPRRLHCYELTLRDTSITTLPSDLQVEYRLDLTGCAELQSLPEGLKVGSLALQGCASLRALPEGLEVYFLDISGCTRLARWPEQATVRVGRLNARGCRALSYLPSWMTQLAQLDLRGCESLTALPQTLRVSSWIDLADTQITELPAQLAGARLRWRGVPIDARIAFHPETITAREVLGTTNAELRRVLLERMGYERFLSDAHADELDRDTDPGGERRLLRVPMINDEALVCISVLCPSTGRQYIIRVPPRTRTCRQAAAWIAGFDNTDDYRPIMET